MMRRIMVMAGKIFLSGMIAFCVLNLFSFFYRNLPSADYDADGVTESKLKANTFYFQGYEGFSWGRTNNDGYTNLIDYDEQTQVDVLIMGASHMEAFQVPIEKSAASRLNALLEDKIVYNVGRSGHYFLTCAKHLDAAVTKYRPSEYVVIQAPALSYSDSELTDALNGGSPAPYREDGAVRALLKKSDYLMLLYVQYVELLKGQNKNDVDAPETMEVQNAETNADLLNQLLEKMAHTVRNFGAKLIIVYHPRTSVQPDGTLLLTGNSDEISLFQSLCEQHGILFLDMADRFQREYDERHVLPYGFSNTSVGTGHLNQYGHEMIADELYKLIAEE